MSTIDPHFAREAQKYEHPIVSRECILDHLHNKAQPRTWRQLCADFDLTTDSDIEALRRRLLAMVRDGQLYANRRGAYGVLSDMELITGYIVGHKDGFGFLVPDDGSDDLFVTHKQMQLVFPGDRVTAQIAENSSYSKNRDAVIVAVLEHNTNEVVGKLVLISGYAYIQPLRQDINHDILIHNQNYDLADVGKIVVATIITQPAKKQRPVGVIIEILGDYLDYGIEIEIALRNHGLPHQWPAACLDWVAKIDMQDAIVKECARRYDLRKLPFVTIDGEDAQDFDDAVYCASRDDGLYDLYVAIADVSYYVAPGSAIDHEALKRGNSVYFPGRVIPMLPEILANEWCSLQPHKERLTLVCQMLIDARGAIQSYQFYEAVIISQARLTYNQGYAWHNGDYDVLPHDNIASNLKALFTIYAGLSAARQQRGAIDFQFEETQIIFASNGKIKTVVPLMRNIAHAMIEECMLAANMCAADYLISNNVPGLYRNHATPSPDKLIELQRLSSSLGLLMQVSNPPQPAHCAQLLQLTAHSAHQGLIQTLLLRSLSKAVYAPDNLGHFGLALSAYTHFTSPIRRYPDLIIHRIIKSILTKQELPTFDYQHLGEHCSMTERRADDATREAIDWLRCEFMRDKIGQVFNAKITGVQNFGVFVVLDGVAVEGLVHISSLPNDYYHFDAMHLQLKGKSNGAVYSIGDMLTVQVARVDLEERLVDFVLYQEEDAQPSSRKSRTQGKKPAEGKKARHAKTPRRKHKKAQE